MNRTYAGTDGKCTQGWRRLEAEQMAQAVASHRQGLKVRPRKKQNKTKKKQKNIAAELIEQISLSGICEDKAGAAALHRKVFPELKS